MPWGHFGRCLELFALRSLGASKLAPRDGTRVRPNMGPEPLSLPKVAPSPLPVTAATTDPMIRVDSVTKSYGSAMAVSDVSFSIRAGEVVGFLGPNGAGKSTLLKMIATWHEPDAGTISVAGLDTQEQPLAVRHNLGYLPEHNALWDTMNVGKLLDFVGKMRGLTGDGLAARKDWVIDRCELGEVLHKRVNQCSKGFRQRIGVAGALLHDPPVVLLDEPTHGLDPMQVVAFREFIRELATLPITTGPASGAPGRAVLFSSHILAEVAAISDRILVIRGGKLLMDERTDDLRQRAGAQGTSLEQLVVSAMDGTTSEVIA